MVNKPGNSVSARSSSISVAVIELGTARSDATKELGVMESW